MTAPDSKNWLDRLADLEATCFDRPWSPAQLADWIRSPGNRVWLLADDALHQPVSAEISRPERGSSYNIWGYLLVQDHPHEAMTEILRIGVVPGERRKGRAARLIDELMEKLRAQGQKKSREHWKIMLEVSENNTAGRALYRSRGFEEIHRRRSYYTDGSDALVLERRLSGPSV